ncbi:DMT family transporter [Gloeocapsa sp. PCC 73106]|uniref:DMT family transporter n=1 Tax=Gloeocapsa sp. PCC 73106 TaxID=102232 RepID=UPI0002ACDDFD|nr:DMT family transporter [Gloeocapsa sp. PCC 73106]ELR99194.1 DMT(drug/metabolite transporter) superfamily permease [Gloeocapsa sp. PCC 73106]
MQLNSKTSEFSWYPLLLISPFFFWGTAMVAMKGTIEHTTPLFMASVRLLPAGLLVLAVTGWQKRPQPQNRKAWLWIALFALIDGAMFQGFLSEGLVRTDAGLGSVMIDSQPLAVALLSSFLFGEVIGGVGFLGLGIGILGISLIGLPESLIVNLWEGNSESLSATWLDFCQGGQWLMLLAALSMALGTVIIRFVSRHVDTIVATGWHMVLGGLLLLVLSGNLESQQWQALNFHDWLALAYSTVFGSAISYGVFFYLAAKGNLTSLSSLTFLTPVFALTFGNLFLAEVLTPIQWLGVCLTLVSIYLINQREKLVEIFSNLGNKVTEAFSEKIQKVKS